ncbi:MAG: hypothetical protein L3J00_04300 [Thiomicrorhabdus sp.]|nr:hypothetical protein [Thiomicrorhabdus sp.]
MKTLTMRVDDAVYEMIKRAANGQKRNMSNFIEFATIQYLTSNEYVDSAEMSEILSDKKLISNLKQGISDVKNGDFTLV